MKKLFLLTVLLTIFALSGMAQDVSLPRDVAEKALTALELVPALETKIEKLENQVKALESAKLTPCTLAAEKVKQDYVFWLQGYDTASPEKRKQIDKMLKFTRKQGRKMLQSQCGYKSESVLGWAWDAAKVAAPFVPLLW